MDRQNNVREAQRITMNLGEVDSINISEKRKKKQMFPLQLLSTISLNKNDPNQQFYRQMKRITSMQLTQIKMGWYIAPLSRSQQDMTLSCFSLLETQINFPLKLFLLNSNYEGNSPYRGQNSKYLWMQTELTLSGITQNEQLQNMELVIYKMCFDKILPLFKMFIETYLSWKYMLRKKSDDKSLLDIFTDKVIYPLKNIVDNAGKRNRKGYENKVE